MGILLWLTTLSFLNNLFVLVLVSVSVLVSVLVRCWGPPKKILEGKHLF